MSPSQYMKFLKMSRRETFLSDWYFSAAELAELIPRALYCEAPWNPNPDAVSSVKCKVWSTKYEVLSVKYKVWSVKCVVWIVVLEAVSALGNDINIRSWG